MTERVAPTTLQNARDVGGLHTDDGRRVRHGVLYRSDAPVPGDGQPPLDPWPPRYVVDLRSAGEAGDGHPLAAEDVEVISSPLLAEANPMAMITAAERQEVSLVEGYPTLLANGTVIGAIAELVARADGPVLVHCSAGKDRTGVAVAVLLAAAGVRRTEIVADFEATERNIDAVVARMVSRLDEPERAEALAAMTGHHAHLMRAPGEAIAAVLDVVDDWPGGARGWLREHGAGDEAIDRLTARLVED